MPFFAAATRPENGTAMLISYRLGLLVLLLRICVQNLTYEAKLPSIPLARVRSNVCTDVIVCTIYTPILGELSSDGRDHPWCRRGVDLDSR